MSEDASIELPTEATTPEPWIEPPIGNPKQPLYGIFSDSLPTAEANVLIDSYVVD